MVSDPVCGMMFPFDANGINYNRMQPTVQQPEQLTSLEPVLTSSSTENSFDVQFLNNLESFKDKKALNDFRSSSAIWNDEKKYEALFDIWTKIKQKSVNLPNDEPLNDLEQMLHQLNLHYWKIKRMKKSK